MAPCEHLANFTMTAFPLTIQQEVSDLSTAKGQIMAIREMTPCMPGGPRNALLWPAVCWQPIRRQGAHHGGRDMAYTIFITVDDKTL